MTWRRSATGKTVASDGRDRLTIEPLRCFKDGRSVLRYRVRVNGDAIGGVYPTLFETVPKAKAAALEALQEERNDRAGEPPYRANS